MCPGEGPAGLRRRYRWVRWAPHCLACERAEPACSRAAVCAHCCPVRLVIPNRFWFRVLAYSWEERVSVAGQLKVFEGAKTASVLRVVEPLLARHLWDCAHAALQEARAAARAEGVRLGVPEDRLQTLPLPHPAHMLPGLYTALRFPGDPLAAVWPASLPSRQVVLPGSEAGVALPGNIVGWDGDAASGMFLVAERGLEAAVPFSGADPQVPARWHRVPLAELCACNPGMPQEQLLTLRDWLASEANLRGTKSGPQATVALGALRLPAPLCVGMPGACFERLPHNASTGTNVEDAKTKRHLWSYVVGSPGEVVLLFTARLSAGMNTASWEGWDICATQLVLDSCPRLRQGLPGGLTARELRCLRFASDRLRVMVILHSALAAWFQMRSPAPFPRCDCFESSYLLCEVIPRARGLSVRARRSRRRRWRG
jgi:hypothetical protein